MRSNRMGVASDKMKYIAALLALLYSASVTPEQVRLEWWQQGEFGACTKTDIQELGACGTLEIKFKPQWRNK